MVDVDNIGKTRVSLLSLMNLILFLSLLVTLYKSTYNDIAIESSGEINHLLIKTTSKDRKYQI